MDRRSALAGIGSLGFLACSPNKEMDERLSSEIFLFRIIPGLTFPEIKKITYIDIDDNPVFDAAYFYSWLTLDQLQRPGTVFRKVLKVVKGKYTAEHLIDMLNIQLNANDNLEFYRSEQGHIKAKLLHLSGVPDTSQQSISKIS